MNHFIDQMMGYLLELELDYPIRIGILDEAESLIIVPAEGSEVIREYMNGMMDIRLPFTIKMKSSDQEYAFHVLSDVMNRMRNMGEHLDQAGKDHPLIKMVIDPIPFFEGKKADGYFHYSGKVTVDLTLN